MRIKGQEVIVRGSFFRKHGESYCLEYERQNKLSLSLSSNKDRCVQALLLLTCHDTFLVQINFNQKTPIIKHISDIYITLLSFDEF